MPDLSTLSHSQKDALIVALWERVVSLTARLTALDQRLDLPKTPDNCTPTARAAETALASSAASRLRVEKAQG